MRSDDNVIDFGERANRRIAEMVEGALEQIYGTEESHETFNKELFTMAVEMYVMASKVLKQGGGPVFRELDERLTDDESVDLKFFDEEGDWTQEAYEYATRLILECGHMAPRRNWTWRGRRAARVRRGQCA